MRLVLLVSALSLFGITSSFAQEQLGAPVSALSEPSDIRDLDAVTVSGVQPGPGMWKVSKGDHVMWVLGTLSPLPAGVTWHSRPVEAVIAQSQEVLKPPRATIGKNIGTFRALTLIPSVLGARKNPDGNLKDVLPPDLYARWLVLKEKYVGRDSGIEKRRPFVAAAELYGAAMKKSGLKDSGAAAELVNEAAKKHAIKVTRPELDVPIDDPRAAIKEFRQSSLGDVDCFRQTLDQIETNIPAVKARARAWALGDVEALRALPFIESHACESIIINAEFARKRGLSDIITRLEQLWLAAAEKALTTNQTTFATLSINEVLKPNGYLAKLQAKGYLVEAPE